MEKPSPLSDEELKAFKQQIKNQVLQEMKDEKVLAQEESSLRRKQEAKEHQQYIELMKKSPDSWVEIIGWVETDQGVKVELEWNDAFIDFLSSEGVTGTEEDQIVQKWVAMLLHNIADDMDTPPTDPSESEFSG